MPLPEALLLWVVLLPTTHKCAKVVRIGERFGQASNVLLCGPHFVEIFLRVVLIQAEPLDSFVLYTMTCERVDDEVVGGWLRFLACLEFLMKFFVCFVDAFP